MGLRELPRHLRVDALVSPQLVLFEADRRIYAPYEQWEDYLAGMFEDAAPDDVVTLVRGLLGDPARLREAMWAVTEAWPVASAVNLTNAGCNRRAWLGQAACCFTLRATAAATKRAWWQLTEPRRVAANAVADEVISAWTPILAA